LYDVAPAVDSRWGVAGPYERLGLLLAEVIRTGDEPVEVGRRSVRRQLLGRADSGDPVDSVVDTMARNGFDPLARRRGNRVDVVLQRCPFERVASADPDTVCAIHLGMAQGLAELTGGRLVVEDLVAHDPRRAGCRVRLRLESE
jgi:predicted ArsR family transcriptional regulator